MTEAAYIKMIAHDAATDAITEFIASCSSSYTADDRCAVLKRR